MTETTEVEALRRVVLDGLATDDSATRLSVLESFISKLLDVRHIYDYSDGGRALVVDGDHGAGIRVELDMAEWGLLWGELDPSEEATQ